MCNITNIVTGNAGKAFAAFAVISLGVGFFSGKISLGLLVASSIGISSIFAAPSMVSLLSGKDAYECEEGVTYITDCSVDGVCYSCPAGHVGPNCVCPPGFTGPTCSECNMDGFSLIDGVCKPDCSISPTIPGITDTTVQNGTSSLECNAENYTGSINYSCNNNNFSITSGACACEGNHAGAGCLGCAARYEGEYCDECTSDYTQLADGSCAADCYVNGKAGITDGTLVLPPSGSLTCIYGGTINYSCVGGSFSSADNCVINSRCYQGVTHGTIRPTAPDGHVWAGVSYAEYGAVSGCAANNSAVCSVSPRSRDVKSFINTQCAGSNSCGIYVSEHIISQNSACNPNLGGNASSNKLNFILYYY